MLGSYRLWRDPGRAKLNVTQTSKISYIRASRVKAEIGWSCSFSVFYFSFRLGRGCFLTSASHIGRRIPGKVNEKKRKEKRREEKTSQRPTSQKLHSKFESRNKYMKSSTAALFSIVKRPIAAQKVYVSTFCFSHTYTILCPSPY